MKHSTTHLLEDVEIEIHAGGKHVATSFAREIPVTVEFTYTPGYEGTFGGSMENAEEGFASEVEIDAVKPTLQAFMEVGAGDVEKVGASLVLDAGRCIKYLLTEDQFKAIEKAIDTYMEEGEEL